MIKIQCIYHQISPNLEMSKKNEKDIIFNSCFFTKQEAKATETLAYKTKVIQELKIISNVCINHCHYKKIRNEKEGATYSSQIPMTNSGHLRTIKPVHLSQPSEARHSSQNPRQLCDKITFLRNKREMLSFYEKLVSSLKSRSRSK